MAITRLRLGRLAAAGLIAALALAAITGQWVRNPATDEAGPSPAMAIEARVTRVIDGDTIVVRTADEREETVRYIGIDAPEIDWQAETGPGWAARTANQRLVGGRTVRLELDAEERDRYGRLLAYVHAGDVFVNARLVEQGHALALVVPPNERYADLLLAMQRLALAENRGLWAEAEGLLVDAAEAHRYIGFAATVQGVVRSVYQDPGSGIVLLRLGPAARRDFTAVIRPPFTDLFPSPTGFQGRRVRVRGVVEEFQGQPQIAVQLPAQIEVME